MGFKMDLQNIFESITPDNIKNIPVVKYCMKAFISQLRKDAKVATKISRLFDIDSTDYFYIDDNNNRVVQKDTKIVRLSKENIKKGLVQFYLNVLYKLIEETAIDKDVKTAIKVRSYDSPIFDSLHKVITSEYLGGFRYFQQSSGNKEAINYIYEFSIFLERGYILNDLKLTEEPPLHLKYDGSLHESIFTNFMKKIAHPVGWTTDSQTLLDVADFRDYFGISLNTSIAYIILDSTAADFLIIWYFCPYEELLELLHTQINYHTGKFYTDEDLENVELIYIDEQPAVKTFTNRDVPCKQYILSNGMTIYDNGCVYYLKTDIFNSINWESQAHIDANYINYRNTDTPIQKYLGYRAVPNNDIIEWNFVYYDDMDIDFELYLGYTDDNYYFVDDERNALNISGEPYQYLTGYDECYSNITNYNNIANAYNNAFNIHLTIDIYHLTLFRIYDDFGHGFIRTLTKTNREQQTFDFSSLYFEGSNLYVELIDSENYKTYVYINNLNCNYSDSITNIDYKTRNKLSVTGYANGSKNLSFASENKNTNARVNGSFTHNFDVTACNENEDYVLSLGSVTIKSNLVQQENNRPNIKLEITNGYSSAIGTSSYDVKNQQNGILSGSGDTFYNYTNDNPDTYLNGSIIEGVSIRKNYKTDVYNTYINYGYRKVTSDSIDCLVPSCTRYAEDSFTIENTDANGWYLTFTDMLDNDNTYSDVGRYLYFRENAIDDNYLTEGYILNESSFVNKSDNTYVNDKTYSFTPFETSYYMVFKNTMK